MTPYSLPEFDENSMNSAPSGLNLIHGSNDSSYGSENSEWRSNYLPNFGTSVDRHPQCYSNQSFNSSDWTQLSLVPSHQPQSYSPPYCASGMSFQLVGARSTPTVTPSPPTATNLSPNIPMGALPPPRTPSSVTLSVASSPDVRPSSVPINQHHEQPRKGLYSHRQQLQFFREALSLPISGAPGPFVPQQMYKPHTNNDRKRYVEEIELDAPIFFWMSNPDECGITLSDALHSRVKRLRNRDEPVFEGRGPSVSIRLEWPGYRQWSRQIPTKDFRSPPGPITRAKLAKNVAKCVQRFIEERQHSRLEDDADPKWRVGASGSGVITLDDIILVSMYHVSLGSWQPQLRLRRPFNHPTRS